MTNQTTNLPRLLLRVAEAAELMGIGRSKAYELVATGKLPVVRLGDGRSVRIPFEWLRAYVDQLARESVAELGLSIDREMVERGRVA